MGGLSRSVQKIMIRGEPLHIFLNISKFNTIVRADSDLSRET